MVFVTLICLVVAAYFLWDALKDKKNAEASESLTAAHKISTNAGSNIDAVNYNKNVGATETGVTTNMHESESAPISSNAVPAKTADSTSPIASEPTSDTSNTTNRTKQPDASHSAEASISNNQPSANDANVKTGAAAVAVAAVGASVSQAGLRFLDGPIGRKDDLTQIDGVGPVIEEGLNNVGIFHYHQIANFTEADVRNVDSELDFPGRIAREEWVEQARKLSTISLEQASLEDTNDQLDSVVSIDQHAPNLTHPDSDLTDADYTGVWNTDVLIEIQERLKVLNTRISDAPRLRMTRDEYNAIKAGEDAVFSRARLLEILDRLRDLD